MDYREAFTTLANSIYLSLALSGLGGAATLCLLRRSLRQLGLAGKTKRQYRRKKSETTEAPPSRRVPLTLGQIDVQLLFALWLSLAVLAGGLYQLNAVYQDIFLHKTQDAYLYLSALETLPGGVTAVHLNKIGQTEELVLYDDQARTKGLSVRQDYLVSYFLQTRVIHAIK